MKKLLILFTILIYHSGYSQWIFGENAYQNQQNWDKQRIHFGYTLGYNRYGFKFNYDKKYLKEHNSQEIETITSDGFNIGFVTNLRLMEYVDLRFEPVFSYNKRLLYFPHLSRLDDKQKLREVNSTYFSFPLVLKISALRSGNIRPFVMGGVSGNLNLNSNSDSKEDNSEGTFRMKQWTANYELGTGIDFYFPHFKLSTSIRGVFGLGDELIRDYNPNSPWTSGIESMKTRAIFINFTFH